MRRSVGLWFARVYKPRGYWLDLRNQREFMDDLIKKEGLLNNEEKRKRLKVSLVKKHGGHSLVNSYPTFQDALNTSNIQRCYIHVLIAPTVYPEIEWPKNLPRTNKKDTNDQTYITEHRKTLELIREQLKIGIEGFYHCNESKLRELGGGDVLRHYPSYIECIIQSK